MRVPSLRSAAVSTRTAVVPSLVQSLESRVLLAAAPLDPTFGDGGSVRLDVGMRFDAAGGAYLQPDGKVLVTGMADRSMAETYPPTHEHFLMSGRGYVARLNADGTRDSSFGDDGVLVFNGEPYTWFTAGRVAGVLPDGKILVSGSLYDQYPFFDAPPGDDSPRPLTGHDRGYNQERAFVRLNPDGSLDTTFGDAGFARHPDAGPVHTYEAFSLGADGKLVAAGYVSLHGRDGGADDMIVARFAPDGSLDPAFGGGDGWRVFDFSDLSGRDTHDRAFAVAAQADGKLLVGGETSFTSGDGHEISRFALMRLNGDGSPDATFAGGRVITAAPDVPPPSPWDHGHSTIQQLLVLGDGKLLGVGTAMPDGRLGMVRYNPDGTPDALSGTAGVVAQPAIDHATYHADLMPDGSIRVRGVGSGYKRTPIPVEGGSATQIADDGGQLYLARFDSGGRLVESRTARQVSGPFGAAGVFLDNGEIIAVGGPTNPIQEGASSPPTEDDLARWNVQDSLVVKLDPTNLPTDEPVVAERGDGPGGAPFAGASFAGKAVVRKGRSYRFNVTFRNANQANAAHVIVSGPGGLALEAARTRVKTARRGGAATATYVVNAPGGTFDAADNGAFEVRLALPGSDAAAALASAGGQVAGQFTVKARGARRLRRS